MLVRIWKKGNPCILLVVMEIGAATIENSMDRHRSGQLGIGIPWLALGTECSPDWSSFGSKCIASPRTKTLWVLLRICRGQSHGRGQITWSLLFTVLPHRLPPLMQVYNCFSGKKKKNPAPDTGTPPAEGSRSIPCSIL